jgi:hypothetical protein
MLSRALSATLVGVRTLAAMARLVGLLIEPPTGEPRC